MGRSGTWVHEIELAATQKLLNGSPFSNSNPIELDRRDQATFDLAQEEHAQLCPEGALPYHTPANAGDVVDCWTWEDAPLSPCCDRLAAALDQTAAEVEAANTIMYVADTHFAGGAGLSVTELAEQIARRAYADTCAVTRGEAPQCAVLGGVLAEAEAEHKSHQQAQREAGQDQEDGGGSAAAALGAAPLLLATALAAAAAL